MVCNLILNWFVLKCKVFYYDSKPQDFERSEKITMTGYASDSGFIAETILMKCPSKYNEQQLSLFEFTAGSHCISLEV